jgi:hypothetical protein
MNGNSVQTVHGVGGVEAEAGCGAGDGVLAAGGALAGGDVGALGGADGLSTGGACRATFM